MKVKILYFSSIKDKIKKSDEILDVQENTSVEDLLKILKKRYPNISQIIDSSMVAVNEEYVSKDHTLKENDTVAVIPPVSGG